MHRSAHVITITEIYDPLADKSKIATKMLFERSSHTTTVLKSGKILAAGGSTE